MHVSTMAAWDFRIAIGVGWSKSRPAASTARSREKSIARDGRGREEELDEMEGRRVSGWTSLECRGKGPSVEETL